MESGNVSVAERLALQLRSQVDAFRAIIRNAPIPESFVKHGLGVAPRDGSVPHFGSLAPIPDFELAPSASQVAERHEFLVRTSMINRMDELRSLPDNLPRDVAVDAVLELKALEAFPSQSRLREVIVEEARKMLQIAATSVPQQFRIHTDAQTRDSAEQDETKLKQGAFLRAVTDHARNFMDMKEERRKVQKIVNSQLQREWEKAARKKQMEEERQERERVQMLREGDEEGYLRMVQQKKNARLEMLLQQTADFMSRISALVQMEKDRVAAEDEAAKAEAAKEAEEQAAQEAAVAGADGAAAAEQSQNAAPANAPASVAEQQKSYTETRQSYYSVAHSVQEEVVQPDMLKFGKLREYQLKGLQWLVSLYNNNLNGILADEMGLGKTIQTISLIAYLIERKNNAGPFLIIVPLSTLSNWKDEFDRWAPDVALVVYKGNPKERQNLWTDRLAGVKFNVMLTTFEYVMKDKSRLSRLHWNFLVLDEGHRIKNSESQLAKILREAYRPKHRLLLTGTPLQNSLPELWSLLNFLLPSIFNSVDTFETWFNAPFESAGEKLQLTEEERLLIIRRLHNVIRPFLLRRLKKEVEKQLPDKMEKVLRCDMSVWQRVLYDRMLQDRTLMTEGGVKGLQNKLMQLRKICNHPYLFDEKAGFDIDEKMIRAAGKFALLDRILPKLKRSGHRVLMFSQMTSLMNILEYYFQLRGYVYLRLDGATKQEDRREAMVQWNAPNSPYFLFILSTRAGGLGLNLQTADTVILFDSDWNPQADLQAQDRAHRIGQTKRVLVLRLITAHSIEERILETATRKLGLDQKVIGAGLFNQSSDNKERRSMLEFLLKADNQQDDEAEVHTLAEINERISRSEEEFQMFNQMDQDRDDERKAREAAGEVVPPEMVAFEELPEWLSNPQSVQLDPDNIKFKDIEGVASDSFGRGKRRRAAVNYSEQLTEEEFCMLMDRGADEEEVRKYIAERDAKGIKPVADEEEDDEQDEDADAGGGGKGEEDGAPDGDDMPVKRSRKSGAPAKIPDEKELETYNQGMKLHEVLQNLADASGRKLSVNWQQLWGAEGPPSVKARGRPRTANKPPDMNDISEKLSKYRYKRFAQVVGEFDKMFHHLLETLPPGPERTDASEGLKALHICSISIQMGGELPKIVAYAINNNNNNSNGANNSNNNNSNNGAAEAMASLAAAAESASANNDNDVEGEERDQEPSQKRLKFKITLNRQ